MKEFAKSGVDTIKNNLIIELKDKQDILDIVKEVYTILMNKLLEIPLQEYEKAIEEEHSNKKTINVIGNEI